MLNANSPRDSDGTSAVPKEVTDREKGGLCTLPAGSGRTESQRGHVVSEHVTWGPRIQPPLSWLCTAFPNLML